MKFDYNLKMPKWLNEKNTTIISMVVDLILIFAAFVEVYYNSSNLLLMMMLNFYLTNDIIDKYFSLKMLKHK